MSGNKTIFIAEDSENVRDNLRKIISHIEGLQIIGEAAEVKKAIEISNSKYADIYLIDIGLSDGSGIEFLKHIKANNQSAVALIFTNYVSTPYEIICNKLGADYFLDKTKDLDKLIEILQKFPESVD